MAPELHVLLVKGERPTEGELDLGTDDVDAGDHLGDRVFHLETGVDLHEVEVHVLVDQELHGAGVGVVGGLGRLDRGGADVGQQLLVGNQRRGDLDELLVAALDGAVAGAQMDHLAVVVGDDLHLDVLGGDHHLFEVDVVVVEGGLGLGAGRGQLGLELFFVLHPADSPPPATGGGLEHHRIAVLLAEGQRLLDPGVAGREVGGAGYHGDAGLLHDLAGGDLVAQGLDHLGAGTDEDDARLMTGLGEIGILGQKAVAGVDGVGLGLLGRGHHLVDIEIVAARPVADMDRLVGRPDMKGVGVRGLVDGHGGMTKLLNGADQPQGDLTSVCYQYLLLHFFQGNTSLAKFSGTAVPFYLSRQTPFNVLFLPGIPYTRDRAGWRT